MRTPVSDLVVGQRVSGVYLLLDAEIRPSARGRFLTATLADRSGSIRAVWFDAAEWAMTAALRYRVVVVEGLVSTFDDRRSGTVRQIRMDDLRPAPDDAFLGEILPTAPRHIAALRTWRSELIGSVDRAELRAFLATVFGDPAITDRFDVWSAAKRMHHAVHHGLLQHSCEVAAIGAGICATEAEFGYGSRADRDIVIAGGLLHDIGKIHELDCSAGVATYTAAGCLEGHVILGHSIVRDYARQCEISSRLLRALLHIILSHPGLPDHGAAVRPATLEAEIVHRADALSADMYMIHTAVSGASTDEMTVRVPGRDMWFFNAAADAGDALTAPVSASDPEPDNPFRTALYERAGVPPPQRSTDADDLGDPFRDS